MLTLLLFLLLYPQSEVPLQDKQAPQSPSHKEKAAPRDEKATPAMPVEEGKKDNREPQQPPAQKEEHQATDINRDYLFWGLIVNGIIAVGTFAVAVIAVIQAIAAKRSANAALLTAQSLVNSERAWIRVQMYTQDHAIFDFEVVNVGRTPARIVGYYYLFAFPPHMDFAAADSHVIKRVEKDYGAFVPPDAPDREAHLLEEFRDDGTFITPEQWKAIKEKRNSFVFKGQIKYFDVVNEKDLRVTAFCYYFNPDRLHFSRPPHPEYNTYT